MTKEAKRRYISSFWSAMAAQLNQPTEDIIQSYKQRVDYTNAKYSHFEKGWKSDMGRIYIRNGPPSDVEEDTTSDEKRFVPKDYQIWKYSGRVNAVYIFVDIPMNGNFKLVYARNDEQESTLPNWRRYLGTDFDESSLEN
jgi:GWxTD domain-containing protein